MTRDIGDLYFYISMGIGIALLAAIIFGRVAERLGVDSLERAIHRELRGNVSASLLMSDRDAHH